MSVRETASPSTQGAQASNAVSPSDALASTLVAQASDAEGGLDARSLGQDIRQFAEQDPAFARQTLEAVGNQLFEAGQLGDAAALHQGYSETALGAGEAAAHGAAGAVGRESAVQSLMLKAHQAGVSAPQGSFDGTVYRSVPSRFEASAIDYSQVKGSVGRYNAASESLIYTSPSRAAALHEAGAYAEPGRHPLEGRSLVSMDFHAKPDAQGRHGVADLAEGARQVGLPVEALTDPKGNKPPSLLYQLAGEHPYSLGQQSAKGAADAGASAIRAPSATGEPQIDIIPRNTHPSQLVPRTIQAFADGQGGPVRNAEGLVKPMPDFATSSANDPAVREGPLQKDAGQRSGPDVKNQWPEQKDPRLTERTRQWATNAQEGYPRSSSVRYGAAGGVAASLAQDAWTAVRGGPVDGAQAATHAVEAGALGAAAGKATDVLARPLGLRAAGGAVAGALEAATSTARNTDAFRRGDIPAAQATANIAVDTGTAVGAGVAVAAAGSFVGSVASAAVAGSALGSVVPIAGTAVGAVAGFAVGAVAYVAVQKSAEISGLMDSAKTHLGKAWSGAEQQLGNALHRIGNGMDAARNAISALKFW
jgi:hypothetical protein